MIESHRGVDIDEDKFKRLQPEDQMVVIFRNTCDLKQEMRGIKFHQKVQYVLLGACISGLVWFAKVLIENSI